MNIYLFKTADIEHHVVTAEKEENARKLVVDHLIMLWGEDEAKELLENLTLAAVFPVDEEYLWTYYSDEDDGENTKLGKFRYLHNHPGCIPYA